MRIICPGIVLILIAFTVFPQDTLNIPELDEALKQGNTALAVSVLEDWLLKNTESSDLILGINKYFEVESNIDSIRVFLNKLLQACTNTENRVIITRHLAQIEELSGNIEITLKLYKQAAELSLSSALSNDDKAALFLQVARMYYEQGMNEEARTNLEQVFVLSNNREIMSFAYVLKAHILLAVGNTEEAEGEYFFVLAVFKGYPSEVEALLGLVVLYKLTSQTDKAREYLEKLKVLSPDSPEYKLALEVVTDEITNVTFILSPQRYFTSYLEFNYSQEKEAEKTETTETAKTETEPEKEPSSSQPETEKEPVASADKTASDTKTNDSASEKERNDIFYVQVGSFIVRENADYMIRELTKNNFTAIIMKVVINNKVYYRVLVGSYPSYKEAQKAMILLKEKGFEGFVFQKR